jgi:cystathionine beta-lyase/cystathionine gamma-synthase
VQARAFYEAVGAGLHVSPHLGARRTLVLAYNALVFGRAFEREYHRRYGIVEEAVRVSVGLEEWEDLRDTVDAAVAVAGAVWAREEEEKKIKDGNGK